MSFATPFPCILITIIFILSIRSTSASIYPTQTFERRPNTCTDETTEIAEWTFTITSQSVVEKIGVAVTQGSLTGTLKTALTGDSTSINIESALGITFLTTADLVVGSTTVAHTNIATAKDAILRGPAKLKLRTLDFSNCDDLDQSYVSNDYFVNHNEYLEIMSKVSVKLSHGPRKNDIIFGSIDTARVPNNTVNVLYDDNKISYGVPSRYVLNNNQKSKKEKKIELSFKK